MDAFYSCCLVSIILNRVFVKTPPPPGKQIQIFQWVWGGGDIGFSISQLSLLQNRMFDMTPQKYQNWPRNGQLTPHTPPHRHFGNAGPFSNRFRTMNDRFEDFLLQNLGEPGQGIGFGVVSHPFLKRCGLNTRKLGLAIPCKVGNVKSFLISPCGRSMYPGRHLRHCAKCEGSHIVVNSSQWLAQFVRAILIGIYEHWRPL